ncbi:MAG: hypothetical protein ACPL1A_00670 [Candidatus Kapaibacteriota bacterium]
MNEEKHNFEEFKNDENFLNNTSQNDNEEIDNGEIEPLLTQDDFREELSSTQDLPKIKGGTKIIKQKDIQSDVINFNEEEIEKIMSSNEQLTGKFEELYKDEDLSEEENYKEYQIKNFRDFLVLPKISGAKKSISNKRLIPKEIIEEGKEKVEILNKPPFQEIQGGESSIIVNRNIDGEIESIEVVCKDGERILIKFDFEDSDNLTQTID